MPLTPAEKSWLLTTMNDGGWLTQTMPDFQDALFDQVTLNTYKKGETIFSIGDPGGINGFATGSGIVSVDFEDLGVRAAHIIHTGSWIGAASILGHIGRSVHLTAAQNCSVIELSVEKADAMLADCPDYWRWFGLMAAQNQNISLRAAKALLSKDPVKKLTATILRLLDEAEKTDTVVELVINQTSLAEMSNLSRGFVSGCLSKLEKDGIIEKRYGSISILDRKKLVQSTRTTAAAA